LAPRNGSPHFTLPTPSRPSALDASVSHPSAPRFRPASLEITPQTQKRHELNKRIAAFLQKTIVTIEPILDRRGGAGVASCVYTQKIQSLPFASMFLYLFPFYSLGFCSDWSLVSTAPLFASGLWVFCELSSISAPSLLGTRSGENGTSANECRQLAHIVMERAFIDIALHCRLVSSPRRASYC
jgi:hypothetical protein